MRRLLAPLILMPLMLSCGKQPATIPRPIDPCVIPAFPPPPKLHPVNGCLPIQERVALAQWIVRVNEIRNAVEACPLIKEDR